MNNIKGAELLSASQRALSRGLTQREHAASLGLPYTTYKSRMYRALQQNDGPIPESRYLALNAAPQLEGDWLIMGDMHIPYHNAPFINKCIEVAHRLGIKNLLLGGDNIDNEAVSHWPEEIGGGAPTISREAEMRLLELAQKMTGRDRQKLLNTVMDMGRNERDLSAEIAAAREVFRALGEQFDRIVMITGNHESRITRALGKSMDIEDINRLFGVHGEKWEESPYYYADILSGGEPVHVTHPFNSGKGSSKKIVSQYNSHVVMLHNHHFSVQSDPSGQWLAIEPGMCADPERMSFESLRDRSTDKHVVGAVIVQNGCFTLLNLWTNFDNIK